MHVPELGTQQPLSNTLPLEVTNYLTWPDGKCAVRSLRRLSHRALHKYIHDQLQSPRRAGEKPVKSSLFKILRLSAFPPIKRHIKPSHGEAGMRPIGLG